MHLLERQKQLDELNRCFHEARAACGKLVLIAGDAGLGKSSLVERFMSEHRRDSRTLWGACDGLSTPRALAPVHEIAQAAGLGKHVGHSEETRDFPFRLLLDELARAERVSVVVLEDLHWADAATLDFVRFIGRRIQRTSAVFVVTYRDDALPSGHPVRLALGEISGHHVIRMRLTPLSLSAVEVLAKESGRDAALIHHITGGNPFFVREVLSSPDELVPQTVRDAVVAQLMRCSAATRELAELVALSPGRSEAWLIESVLGSAQAAAIDEAGTRGLFEVQTDSVGFRHELARLAVLGTIAPERARAMHGQVLESLIEHDADPARLVHHAALAQLSAAVLEYAPLAAREAARLGAHREAASHLNAALRYGSSLQTGERAELLEDHARESSLANQAREAIASGTAALAAWREAGNVEAQARVLSLLSQEYRTVGETADADESVSAAIALLEALPPGSALAMAYNWQSLLAVHRGRDREALEFGQRALELARSLGDRAAESHALCNIGGARLGTGDPSGYEALERSLALALEDKLEEHAARAHRTLLFYAVLTHDFARAQRTFQESVEYCEERGIFSHSAYIRAYYTSCELDRGKWAEAVDMATQLLHSSEVIGVQQRITILTTLALVRLRRGDPGAEELLDEALKLAIPTSELNRIGRVAAARAEAAFYSGNLADVAREAQFGLTHVGEHTAPWIRGELRFWQSRARSVGPSADDVAEPYRLMIGGDWQSAARAWERIGMPYEQALALAEGPEEALRDALGILEPLGAGPLAAMVRLRLRKLGARGIPRGPRASTRGNPVGLTTREVQVLTLLVSGHTNSQLAHKLHVSAKTVEHHVSSILEKLEVHSRTEAVAAAFGLGILKPAD